MNREKLELLGSSCGMAPDQAKAATMEMILLFGLPYNTMIGLSLDGYQ